MRRNVVVEMALILAAALTGMAPAVAHAQASAGAAPSVRMIAPPATSPTPAFGFEPSLPPEQQGAREQELYPSERIRSVHAPAFVRSATRTVRMSPTSGMRMGLSGWTSPRVPYDFQESSGGAAFGLTIEWGVPMEPPAEAAPQTAPPSQR
jgi:hypothetical protein